MPHYNLIDPEAVEAFLTRFSEGADSARLAPLMGAALARALPREAAALEPVTSYPANPPAWLTPEKFAQNGPFYRLQDDDALKSGTLGERLTHIRDWLLAAVRNDAPWIEERDAQGRVKALANIGTIEHAMKLADKAMRRAQERRLAMAGGLLTQPQGQEEKDGHIKTVQVNEDGSRWVRLLTPEALDRESAMMQHCIGDGGYDAKLDDNEYYSLRNRNGEAHVTLEVVRDRVMQCQGKQNKAPIKKYAKQAGSFIKEKGWLLFVPPSKCRMVQDIDRNYYDLDDLPEELTMRGPFKLEGEMTSLALPRRLRITNNGAFSVVNCKYIDELPEELLADFVEVRGSFVLKEIPGSYTNFKRGVRFDDCPDLRFLPGKLRCEHGDVSFVNCIRIRRLPAELYVGKDLNLRNCDLLERLPEGLFVGHDLLIHGCENLKSFPKDTIVQGFIYSDLGTFALVEEARAAFEKAYGKPVEVHPPHEGRRAAKAGSPRTGVAL